MVEDGHAVGVAAEVAPPPGPPRGPRGGGPRRAPPARAPAAPPAPPQNMGRSAEGRLGIDERLLQGHTNFAVSSSNHAGSRNWAAGPLESSMFLR